MRIARAAVVAAAIVVPAAVTAPPAAACLSVRCVVTCVESVIDGDLKVYCPF